MSVPRTSYICYLLLDTGKYLHIPLNSTGPQTVAFGPSQCTVVQLQLNDGSLLPSSLSPPSSDDGSHLKRRRLDEEVYVTVRYTEVHDDNKACRKARVSHQATLQELHVALQRAEDSLQGITGVGADRQELFAGLLEVDTITAELKRRQSLQSLEYDRTRATHFYDVYVGEPSQLLAIPGEPTLIVHARRNTLVEAVHQIHATTETVQIPTRPELLPIRGVEVAEIDVHCTDMCVSGNRVYVLSCKLSPSSNQVHAFDVEDRMLIHSWPLRGYSFSITATEFHVFACRDTGGVDRYTTDGEFRGTIGSRGDGDGQLRGAQQVVAYDGRLYVADSGNDRVQVFSTAGTFLCAWGSNGRGSGRFQNPCGLAVHDDSVYVTDTGNSRVQVFSLDGDLQRVWGRTSLLVTSLRSPFGIIVHNEEVYVSDSKGDSVQVFNLFGTFLRMLHNVDSARRLAVANHDQLWVCSWVYTGRRAHTRLRVYQ